MTDCKATLPQRLDIFKNNIIKGSLDNIPKQKKSY